MEQILYIIRGLPGSGKSTLAEKMSFQNMEDLHNARMAGAELPRFLARFEADDFFLDINGNYAFDPRFLGAAHDACYGSTMFGLRMGRSAAVSNTFTAKWEVNRYLDGLKTCGLADTVAVKIIHCTGDFGSIHDVPEATVEKMRQRWQPIDGETKYNGYLNEVREVVAQ